jgi:hypothetical protein
MIFTQLALFRVWRSIAGQPHWRQYQINRAISRRAGFRCFFACLPSAIAPNANPRMYAASPANSRCDALHPTLQTTAAATLARRVRSRRRRPSAQCARGRVRGSPPAPPRRRPPRLVDLRCRLPP